MATPRIAATPYASICAPRLLEFRSFVPSKGTSLPFFRRVSTFTNSIRFVISFYLKEEAYNIGANSAGPSRRYFERREKEEKENPPRNISSSPRSGISRKSTIYRKKTKKYPQRSGANESKKEVVLKEMRGSEGYCARGDCDNLREETAGLRGMLTQ